MTCPKCGLQIDGTSGRCPFCHTEIGSREDSGRLPERAASPLLLIFAALLAAFSGLTIVIFAGFTFGYVLAGPQDSYVEVEDWYLEDEPSPFGPFLPVPMESQLIFSEGGLSITADRLAVEDVWEPELSLTLSNDTDETVVFTAKAGSVNGFMNQMRIWQEIPPGQSAEGILVLDGYGLDLCGISTVRNLEVNFEILRGESQLPLLETGLLTVVTEAGEPPAPEAFPSRLLFQESGIRVSLLPIPPDSSVWQEDGPLILAENLTDQPVTLQAVHVMADGASTPASLYLEILPGCRAVEQLYLTRIYLTEDVALSAAFDAFDSSTGRRLLTTDMLPLNAPKPEADPIV